MYDDYDFEFSWSNDFDLDESAYRTDLDEEDEEYSRDSHDYQDLAYRHYA